MNNYFSPSADRNKKAILGALKPELSAGQLVLEIGSGTGQHASYFASSMPEIFWQPTELESNIAAINSWRAEQPTENFRKPLILDVDSFPWSITNADVCYTCNTLHIISITSINSLFKGCSAALKSAGKLCVYGPFSIDDQHSSQSNIEFDQQLRLSDPAKGVRDLTKLDSMAQQHEFKPCRYTAMPANNLFVVWELLSG